MKKVLVFGTFDGIHDGHLGFFNQAKEHGDYLIVVVARDKTVKKIKGQYPLKRENERLKEVKGQELVSEAKLGGLDNPYKIIEKLLPDIICLGYDQNSFSKNLEEEIKNRGLDIKIVRLRPYQPDKYHSSLLMKHKT